MKLREGHYVATKDIKDEGQHNEICKAFIKAGAAKGEFNHIDWADFYYAGWSHRGICFSTFSSSYGDNCELLTPERVLGASTDDNVKPDSHRNLTSLAHDIFIHRDVSAKKAFELAREFMECED